MTLAAADGRTFTTGDEPAFELQALNTTGESATVAVLVWMTGSSPADALSRVPRLPSKLWQHQQTLVLKPHETKAVIVSTQTKLAARQLVSVSMQAVEPLKNTPGANPEVQPVFRLTPSLQSGIVAMNFSTVTPVAQPTLASAK